MVKSLNGRHFEEACHKYTNNMRADYEEIGQKNLEWLQFAQGRAEWWSGRGGGDSVLKAVMNFWALQNVKSLLIS